MFTVVPVTEKHLRDGWKHHHFMNPIALAISEALGETVAVTSTRVHRRCGVYLLPQPACVRLRQLEAGEPVVPFSFQL